MTVPVCPSPMDKARLLGLNPAVLPPECLVLCERCAVQQVCGQGEETYCEEPAQGVGEAAGGWGPHGSQWCSSISGCLLGKPPCSGNRSFVPQAFSPQGRLTVGSVFCFPKSADFSAPPPSMPCKVTHKRSVPGVGAGVSEAPPLCSRPRWLPQPGWVAYLWRHFWRVLLWDERQNDRPLSPINPAGLPGP